jgi:hypothetical protein
MIGTSRARQPSLFQLVSGPRRAGRLGLNYLPARDRKIAAPTRDERRLWLRLEAWFHGPVTDRLEFSFRVFARMHLSETLTLAFAGVLFVETLPLVTGPGLFTENKSSEVNEPSINSLRSR